MFQKELKSISPLESLTRCFVLPHSKQRYVYCLNLTGYAFSLCSVD